MKKEKKQQEKQKERLYVIYSRDEFELPIITGDCLQEVADKMKCRKSSIATIFSHAKKNGGKFKGREYRIFEFDLDDRGMNNV